MGTTRYTLSLKQALAQAEERLKKEAVPAYMKLFGHNIHMPWEPLATVAEPPRTGFTPMGAQVSQAFTVIGGVSGDAMRHTLDVIDSLHGDGNIPSLIATKQSMDRFNGKFVVGQGIFINTKSQIPEFTTVHEAGHVIDFYGFTSGRYESLTGLEMAPVFDAWLASSAYRALQTLHARLSVPSSNPVREHHRQIEIREVNYLLNRQEVWSRAYAQWVATSSQDPILLQQLETLQQKPNYSEWFVQWSNDDFVRIAQEIGLLFKRKGWLR